MNYFDCPGDVIYADSKPHIKTWYNKDERKQFKGLVSVVLVVKDPAGFRSYYDSVLDGLALDFGFERRKRIYKAADLGMTFQGNVSKYRTACLRATREFLGFNGLSASYVVTRVNPKHLVDNKVIIHGRYTSPTMSVTVPKFIDLLQPYHHIAACWHVIQRRGLRNQTVQLDGIDSIPQCEAWEELSTRNSVSIVFNGDRLVPGISTCDIILRSLESFLQQERRQLHEDLIREIVTFGGHVGTEGHTFEYLGNPDLDKIKPLSTVNYNLNDIIGHIHRPILFISAGGIEGQASMVEQSPRYTEILNEAHHRGCSVKMYDPRQDRFLITSRGGGDFFLALNDLAKNQLQALQSMGVEISEWDG